MHVGHWSCHTTGKHKSSPSEECAETRIGCTASQVSGCHITAGSIALMVCLMCTYCLGVWRLGVVVSQLHCFYYLLDMVSNSPDLPYVCFLLVSLFCAVSKNTKLYHSWFNLQNCAVTRLRIKPIASNNSNRPVVSLSPLPWVHIHALHIAGFCLALNLFSFIGE